MTWASQRKLIIISVFVFVLLLIAGGVSYLILHKTPSCVDGIQNQDEEGIDCGGTSCTYLCNAREAEPSVRFVRTFSPLPGRTDVIAYVDNPNTNAAAKQAPYTIELYDDQNTLIASTQGTADLPARSTEPIFVPNLFSGSGVVSHAFLTFSKDGTKWLRATPPAKELEAQNIVYTPGDSPRVTADIHNFTTDRKTRIYLVATMFGADGKALVASATILDTLPPQGNNSVVFTWPTPISETVARVEIQPILFLP